MNRLILAVAAALALSGPMLLPAAAQSLDLLVPSLTFPETPVVLSTKSCDTPVSQAVCQLAE